MVLLLFDNELIHVSSWAEFHDDVEFLSLLDALAIGDDVDVFEFFEQFDLSVDSLNLFFVFAVELDFLYDVVLLWLFVFREVGVPEGSEVIR